MLPAYVKRHNEIAYVRISPLPKRQRHCLLNIKHKFGNSFKVLRKKPLGQSRQFRYDVLRRARHAARALTKTRHYCEYAPSKNIHLRVICVQVACKLKFEI